MINVQHGMIIHHGSDSESNNILIPAAADNKSDRVCDICYNRLFWFDHFLTCTTCGHKVHEDDLRMASKLVAKEGCDDVFLVQPGKKAKTDPDLPPGAVIVETWEA